MLLFTLSLFFLAASAFPRLPKRDFFSVTTVPSTVYNGTVTQNTISGAGGYDGPQLSAVNSDAYEWWYFDVISPDLKTTMVVVFYTATPTGFSFISVAQLPEVTLVQVDVTWPNGTATHLYIPASEAIITTVGNGASGDWVGSGAKFTGSPDLSAYQITFNSPANGISGTFCLNSVAPAHFSNGPAVPGQSTFGGIGGAPEIEWFNAIPDATGTVDFSVYGSPLKFSGTAYHDHNWGIVPWAGVMTSEYWGRGRLGKYSVVWSQVVSTIDGLTHPSIYVAANNKIILASTNSAALTIRPTGPPGVTYPPTYDEVMPTGFTLAIDLGKSGILDVNITIQNLLADSSGFYIRWTGSLVGSLNGGKPITGGLAVFEQFALTP